jgi:hypothetical protein
MEFTLVRSLKTAGYPGSEHWTWELGWAPPELEELLWACGKKFDYLKRAKKDSWEAYAKDGTFELGRDPIDAVATLWLSLNGA